MLSFRWSCGYTFANMLELVSDNSKLQESKSRIHLFRIIHSAGMTADYHSGISWLLKGRRSSIDFDDRWRCAVLSTWYSWYYTVHIWNWESGVRRAIRIDLTLPQLTGGIRITVGDYEILSQHLVRLIRPDRWAIPDRSVIRIFKEIHALTHLEHFFVSQCKSYTYRYNLIFYSTTEGILSNFDPSLSSRRAHRINEYSTLNITEY